MYSCLRGETPTADQMSLGQFKRFLADCGIARTFAQRPSTLALPAGARLDESADCNPDLLRSSASASTADVAGRGLTAALVDVVYSKHTEVSVCCIAPRTAVPVFFALAARSQK